MTATGTHRHIPSPRLAAAVVLPLSSLLLGGFLGAGTASADDRPVVGTSACTQAVERSSSVRNARADLDRAQDAADAAASRLRSASSELAAATKALERVHPGEPGYAGVRERYEEARAAVATAGAQKRSADAALSPAVTTLAQAKSHAQGALCRPAGSDPNPTPNPTPNPPGNPGLPHPHPTDGGGSVDPTGDDGSSAAVSGTQVTDVPAGSAQTGEA